MNFIRTYRPIIEKKRFTLITLVSKSLKIWLNVFVDLVFDFQYESFFTDNISALTIKHYFWKP